MLFVQSKLDLLCSRGDLSCSSHAEGLTLKNVIARERLPLCLTSVVSLNWPTILDIDDNHLINVFMGSLCTYYLSSKY